MARELAFDALQFVANGLEDLGEIGDGAGRGIHGISVGRQALRRATCRNQTIGFVGVSTQRQRAEPISVAKFSVTAASTRSIGSARAAASAASVSPTHAGSLR